MSSDDGIEARKKKAELGWLADPPPRSPRDPVPGEQSKWFLMMGARRLIEQRLERERRAAQDIADRYGHLKELDRGVGGA